MRIDRLTLRNFKGFDSREFQFHPEFNLIVGRNGTGKTSILDALSVATGSWFLGVRDVLARHIRANEVLLKRHEYKNTTENEQDDSSIILWESCFPCEITAHGRVQERDITWSRSLNSSRGRTTHGNASKIKELAFRSDQAIRNGEEIRLPLISYYGTGRLWPESREAYTVSDPTKVASKEELSRLAGYWGSTDPRISASQLTRWIAQQSWITFQQYNRVPPIFLAIRHALISCIENATSIEFDAKLGEVVVEIDGVFQPFTNLSDGQRSMLAMVGDIAQKAAKLNPHLGGRVLRETLGVVLIDELDLHLHPRWQRRVIDDLRRTFPKIQFICTTHSPFLIQSLRSGEELIMLDGQPTADLWNMSLEEIATGIQRVPDLRASQRYAEMKGVAKAYLERLEEGPKAPEQELADFKQRLAESIAPYADNPAFQAFLEMKRVVKLGE
ncbi:MAG: AAA family ATPase [Magnetococcales bacterium]|nr:AAA family ATPase [Magnetococcales bacterium]